MGFPPLRALFWDNNGTLYDDLPVAFGSACATLRAFGVTKMPTLQQYRDEMNSNWREWYWKYGVPPEVTGDEMNVVRKAYYAEHRHEARYRPDAAKFLQAYRMCGLRLAVVSSEITSILQECLDGAKLSCYFQDIRGEAWPKTPALVRSLVKLDVMPEKAVYIDDSEEGLAAAKSVGMRTIGFTNPTSYASDERIRAAKPEATAADFSEVVRIVFSWV
jgi:HAD superfamily hydrolase (TIGR01509 family)